MIEHEKVSAIQTPTYVTEDRFFVPEQYLCPICDSVLEWKLRPNRPDSKMLVHSAPGCSRSGKMYYAPGVTLTELTKEMLQF